jgi:hypothetical protein
MHKKECGQVYCQDLVRIILNKFTLHFLSFILFSTYFKIYTIFWKFKEMKLRKRKINPHSVGPAFGPRLRPAGPAQQPKIAG